MFMHHVMFGGGGPRFIAGSLVALLAIALLAGAVALVVVLVSRGRPLSAPTEPVVHVGQPTEAMRILDERFARGEIEDDEYQRRRRLLGPPPASS